MFSCIDESIISLTLTLSLSLFVDQFSQFSQFVRICHNFHNFLLRERSFTIFWFSLPFSRGLFVFSPVWKMGEKITGHTSRQHSTELAALALHCDRQSVSWFAATTLCGSSRQLIYASLTIQRKIGISFIRKQ